MLEPRVCDDGAEQSFGFLHPILVVRFKQNLIILAYEQYTFSLLEFPT